MTIEALSGLLSSSSAVLSYYADMVGGTLSDGRGHDLVFAAMEGRLRRRDWNSRIPSPGAGEMVLSRFGPAEPLLAPGLSFDAFLEGLTAEYARLREQALELGPGIGL